MSNPYTHVNCQLNYGKDKIMPFEVDSNGYPWASGCNDYNGSDTCKNCLNYALEKLNKETAEKIKRGTISTNP